MNCKSLWILIFFASGIYSQEPFFLEDVNPNSETYGSIIGPSLYIGEVCVIFFGHES